MNYNINRVGTIEIIYSRHTFFAQPFFNLIRRHLFVYMFSGGYGTPLYLPMGSLRPAERERENCV